MSRKKHTHQTKAEAHADEVVLAATATQADANGADGASAEAKPTDPFQRVTIEAQGRIQKLIKSAEELAKTRLSGTRVELLVDGLPARLEKALDAALDRVGLVRKSKLGAAAAGATQTQESRADRSSDGISAEAQPAE